MRWIPPSYVVRLRGWVLFLLLLACIGWFRARRHDCVRSPGSDTPAAITLGVRFDRVVDTYTYLRSQGIVIVTHGLLCTRTSPRHPTR